MSWALKNCFKSREYILTAGGWSDVIKGRHFSINGMYHSYKVMHLEFPGVGFSYTIMLLQKVFLLLGWPVGVGCLH